MPFRLEDRYPTRKNPEPVWMERPVPVLYPGHRTPSPLSAEQAGQFDRDGFLVLPRIYSDEEVRVFREEVERLRLDPEVRASEKTIREPQGDAVRSVFAIHRDNPLFARVAADERIAGVARFLLGGDVYIHQSRLNYKPGFKGKEFYWHSDFETWHAEDGMPDMRAVSCSILLTDNTTSNGPLMLIPGSHRHFIHCVGQTPENHYRESLRKQEYGVPDQASLEKLAALYGITEVTAPAGSAVFFDCNIMHGSNSNITPFPRTNLFYVYNHTGNAVQEGLRTHPPRPDFVAESKNFTPLAIRPERFA
ncbi:ectoine hydroxylase [Leptospirillum ferriphilum]|jgi:ectoine hydroxylase|uniref:Ectoine hydroxylase n=2 Tax=Leptospirillum ferriphilum TaxID=178606 RepID=A0A1V3SVH9_9BACT|nr:ectoine hydroxylase [Leptospirillum ferriphilum]AFS52644.1 putative phytanoyl-CoA dioxygenase [Leptospirillum ferriphilum ML-04]EAY57668.1 MAG: Ectoine hydroxylase [Leptospirillum rubarum]OOH72738.1 ectoine hydroxylase [Leptospirillum ferriphilum]OOH77764.1 ectoine hydroxylase [Leptospirillum ferriphilum]